MIDGSKNDNGIRGRVLLASLCSSAHHYGQVVDSLQTVGINALLEVEQHRAPLSITQRMLEKIDVLFHVDGANYNSKEIYNLATRCSVSVALQMDGIVEYSNTFLNSLSGSHFLQPAPSDVVFAASEHDQRILQAMGNEVIATGLPRFDVFNSELKILQQKSETHRCGVLIATANNPACSNESRSRVIQSLDILMREFKQRGIHVVWRISPEYADILNVQNDLSPIASALDSVEFVMTTASTFAIESILASKPTAIIHPHPWPLWIPSAWVWNPISDQESTEDQALMKRLNGLDCEVNQIAHDSIQSILEGRKVNVDQRVGEVIDSMIAPDFTSEDVQASIQQHYSYKSASQRVTNSLMQMVVDSTDKSKSNIPVVEVQCKITESEYITQFEKILGKGYTEICFVTSRIPTPDLVKLVDQYEEQIAGFVLADARSDSQFLGKKVWSHTELNEIKDVDCLLIHECEVEAFMYAVKTKLPFYLTQSCPYNLSHVQNVLKELQSFSDSENGYTTLSSGLVNAKSYSQGQCIQDSHKSMVLLRGSEDDFQLYKQLKGSRQKGLVVRSVKWSDEELRAPEVFRMRVEQLNGARYAIYGNGFHTQRLLQFSGITHTPQFIFDDHAVVNELSHGIPVVHPNELSPKVAASLHSIFISSKQYEKEMFDQSLIFLPESINRVRFYHSLEQIIL